MMQPKQWPLTWEPTWEILKEVDLVTLASASRTCRVMRQAAKWLWQKMAVEQGIGNASEIRLHDVIRAVLVKVQPVTPWRHYVREYSWEQLRGLPPPIRFDYVVAQRVINPDSSYPRVFMQVDGRGRLLSGYQVLDLRENFREATSLERLVEWLKPSPMTKVRLSQVATVAAVIGVGVGIAAFVFYLQSLGASSEEWAEYDQANVHEQETRWTRHGYDEMAVDDPSMTPEKYWELKQQGPGWDAAVERWAEAGYTPDQVYSQIFEEPLPPPELPSGAGYDVTALAVAIVGIPGWLVLAATIPLFIPRPRAKRPASSLLIT